jgi:hypothetical protein
VESDVLFVGEWVAQVEVLDVNAGGFAFGVRDDVIHEDFAGDQVCSFGGDISWKINEIAPHSVPDSVGVSFLFSVVYYCSDIGGLLSWWEVLFPDEFAGVSVP